MALPTATFSALDQYKKKTVAPGVAPDPAAAPPATSVAPQANFFERFRQQQQDQLNRSRAFEDSQAARVAPQITPGYTDQEKQAQRVATSAPISASFSSAGEQLKNRALMTGSSTALAPTLTRLAQARGLTIAPALAGLEGKFADTRKADEKYNVDTGLQFERDRTGNILNAQGQQTGLVGQEAGVAGQELGASENQKNRDLTASENEKNRTLTAEQNQKARELELLQLETQNNQFNAVNKKPSALQGALTGGLGVLSQYLNGGGASGGSGGTTGVIKNIAGSAAGKGVLGGLGTAIGSWGGAGSVVTPGAATAGTSTAVGSGVLGGIHSGLGAIGGAIGSIPVAGQVALGIAGGVLLGKKVFGIGNTHEKANDWVQHEQNQFDSYMNEINVAEKSGTVTPEQAQAARNETVKQYLDASIQFSAKGKDQRKVIDQAHRTFLEQYGDPSKYGYSPNGVYSTQNAVSGAIGRL